VTEAALIVLGSIVGAVATGGVSAWDAWRRRTAERRVAARLILGDLYVLEEACRIVLESGIWPDRVDIAEEFTRIDATWREQRAAFASGVSAGEWAQVDTVYNNLNRTAPQANRGDQCTKADLDSLSSLKGLVPAAQRIVLLKASSAREREAMVKEFQARSEM